MRDTDTIALLDSIRTPCYVLERKKLIANLHTLNKLQQIKGVKVLLALKGYAFWRCFEEVREIVSGSCASGEYEARLGFEEIGGASNGKEVCVFSPAYKEVDSLLPYTTHIIFNSFSQYQKFLPQILQHNKQASHKISMGLRVNPLYSEVDTQMYNPCAPFSRLGITPDEWQKGVAKFGLEHIEGLHFHTHCEQNADALARTLPHFTHYFDTYIAKMRWINFGGGHHITRKDYDMALLESVLRNFVRKYQCEVFLEPGEAVGWQVGVLVGSVVDIVYNQKAIAIIDVSASAHMPDCLEMPYRPSIFKISQGRAQADRGETAGKYHYRLGGPTCLSGDVIGDFSFDSPLEIGDKVVFEDMLHYTIVKNTTFNGIPLPALGVIENDKSFRILKEFDYFDYKERN